MRKMTPDKVTIARISVIALAKIKGCPNLQRLHLINSRPDEDVLEKMIRGMLEAVGRTGEVEVYCKQMS